MLIHDALTYETPCLNAGHEPVKTRLQLNQVHLLFVSQAHKAHVLIQSIGHSTQGPGNHGQDVMVSKVRLFLRCGINRNSNDHQK